MIGRTEELRLISDAVLASTASCVVVAGPAGVGKTRVSLGALEAVRAEGFRTARAIATASAASIPFGALAQLLPANLAAGSPVELLRRARDALVEPAGEDRFVLVLDDAHLLDTWSAALIHQLVVAGDAFVIVTVRTEERTPDAIVALWKDELCIFIELQALSRAETDELLSNVLEGGVDGETSLALWSATRGNVLFLRELVSDGRERGVLAQENHGVWRWSGRLTIGGRLTQLIETRLGNLTETERSQLELVAFGEPLEVALADELVQASVVEGLVQRGVLEIDVDGSRMVVRSAHPLYAETIRSSCSPLRRASVYRALAEAMAGREESRRDDLLRLASWRLEAGGDSDPETLCLASGHAATLFDFELAERLARAAIDAGGGWPARYALAEPLRGLGRFEEADRLLASLEAGAATDAQRLVATRDRAANLHWGLGHFAEAEAALRAGEERIASEDGRDELAAERARLAAFSNRPQAAIEAVSHILARPDVPEQLGIRAALAAAPAFAMTGQFHEALAQVERWRPVVAARGSVVARHALDLAEALAISLAGDLESADARAEAGYRQALDDGSHLAKLHWASARGCSLLGRGQLKSAVRSLHESVMLLQEFDPTGSLTWTLAVLAQAAAQMGDTRRADAALAEAEAALPNARILFEHELLLARGWAAAARGELSRARRCALEAADWADAHGQYAFAVLALHDLARLGDAQIAAPRLNAHSSRVEGQLTAACSAHATALAGNDAVGLEDAVGALENCGALLRAAEAACDAGAAHRLAGREASARTAYSRARLLTERCEDPRTPVLSQSTQAEELTRREYEIVLLAAKGLSNQAIAGQLVLSVRTVENHLQRAYGKLGVHTRDDLEQLFRSSVAT